MKYLFKVQTMIDIKTKIIFSAVLLLINFLDIELDSRKAIAAIRSPEPIPVTGAVNHFFEGIVALWVYVLAFGGLVLVSDISPLSTWVFVPALLGVRLTLHPIYFALRVVVPIRGISSWGYLGETSATDKFFRWLGLKEKTHYLVRVPVLLLCLFPIFF